jgi:hypothetical protein
MNKDTRLDKYAMPLPEEIFDTLKQAKVFSILDLRYGYYQLPLKEGDKINITFWGINPHGKDCLYQWKFLPFGLKNAPTKFQKVMD